MLIEVILSGGALTYLVLWHATFKSFYEDGMMDDNYGWFGLLGMLLLTFVGAWIFGPFGLAERIARRQSKESRIRAQNFAARLAGDKTKALDVKQARIEELEARTVQLERELEL